jgi:MFS family permease
MALAASVWSMMYMLMSVFPYSGFMVIYLVEGVDHENAGIYAGFLSSSFMVGRAFSSYPWGKIADIYGRKFVLVVSLLSAAVLSIAFGCSTSFAMAMATRFMMGTYSIL